MSHLRRFPPLGLTLLGLFTLLAIAGFAAFGLRPERLSTVPGGIATWSAAFELFAQGHIVLSSVVLFAFMTRTVGLRWLGAGAAVYALSLGMELLGTTWGVPFGAYAYSELLGARWLGRVPWLIPVSWFAMSVPAYAFARIAYPGNAGARVAFGSLILLGWDLVLDPAMSDATRYWVWESTGPYYGMPWLNLFGWFVTGVLLLTAMSGLRADAWIARLSPQWLLVWFGLNLLLPLGLCGAAGLHGAIAASLCVLALTGGWLLARQVPVPALARVEERANR